MHLRALVVLLPLACGGCASMFHGVSELLAISTDPSGAVCNLWRNGQPIGGIKATPGGVVVDKSKDVVTIVCTKPSYNTAYAQLNAQDDSLVGLDVVLAPIALFFDEVVGSAHFYQASVTLAMTPDTLVPKPLPPARVPLSQMPLTQMPLTPMTPPVMTPTPQRESTVQQHL